jgi:hypothetical protein
MKNSKANFGILADTEKSSVLDSNFNFGNPANHKMKNMVIGSNDVIEEENALNEVIIPGASPQMMSNNLNY